MCQDLPEQLSHRSREWDTGVTVETLEEELNAFEQLDKHIIAFSDALHRLAECQGKRTLRNEKIDTLREERQYP